MKSFWFGFLLALPAPGQTPPLVLPAPGAWTVPVDLRPHVGAYWDASRGQLSLAEAQRQPFAPLTTPPPGVSSLSNVCWLTFALTNSSTDTTRLVLDAGQHSNLMLWGLERGRLVQSAKRGWLVDALPAVELAADGMPPSGVPAAGLPGGGGGAPPSDVHALPLVLPPGQTVRYWLQLTTYFNQRPFPVQLYTPAQYRQHYEELFIGRLPLLCFMCVFMGVALFLSITALLQWLTTRDRTYLWWGAYVACNLAMALRFTEVNLNVRLVSHYFSLFSLFGITPANHLMVFAYLNFVNNFLRIQQYQPELSRIIVRFSYGFVVMSGLTLFFGFNLSLVRYVNDLVDNSIAYAGYVVNLGLVAAVVYHRIPLAKVILLGGFLLFAGGMILSASESLPFLDMRSLWRTPSVYFFLSVLLEILVFNWALGYRARQVELEKEQMRADYTRELEGALALRTREVEQQQRRLEEQRVSQLASVFEQRLAETEMTALRAQMNPHFIFNCLNSVKLYTLENDSRAASEYLTKFSRLIRLVLENSRSEKVTLENELETLRLYIDLEAMRFKTKVRYQITLDPGLDTQFIEIPPLLLQPYVENAIWHGLMHKEHGGTLAIDVTQPREDMLYVTITDDGVGRAQAAAYRSKSATRHKSYGLKMTSERLSLINQRYQSRNEVAITDLVDAHGHPAGTQVVIQIPV